MPGISTCPIARERFDEVRKTNQLCSQTLLLCRRTTCCCHLRRKTCYLPIIVAISFTYLCATVIVDTLVARLNVFKSVSNNTFLNLPFQPAEKTFLVGVKPTVLLGNFMSLILVNIFLITPNVPLITMTTNFQFLPEIVLSLIFPP